MDRPQNPCRALQLKLARKWRRGDLPEHVAEAFEAQKQAVDALQRPLAALAEQLEAPLPALPESTAQLTSTSGISVIVPKVRPAEYIRPCAHEAI